MGNAVSVLFNCVLCNWRFNVVHLRWVMRRLKQVFVGVKCFNCICCRFFSMISDLLRNLLKHWWHVVYLVDEKVYSRQTKSFCIFFVLRWHDRKGHLRFLIFANHLHCKSRGNWNFNWPFVFYLNFLHLKETLSYVPLLQILKIFRILRSSWT